MKKIFVLTIATLALNACSHVEKKPEIIQEKIAPIPTQAQAVLKSSQGHKIEGTLQFTETEGKIKIAGQLTGLKKGPHGFHIHEAGDCSAPDFSSAKGHFNPNLGSHGSLDSSVRHSGDLGNINSDKNKKATVNVLVSGLSFQPGPSNIIGKSVIIHEDTDDLKSQPAGNSGKRIACGIIEAL